MKLHGACQCGSCEVVAEGAIEPSELVPRVCDCEYCQKHPSALVSSPLMVITVTVDSSSLYKAFNGSGQATFYHCKSCNQLLAVGAVLDGRSLGAVNALLFGNLDQFSAPVAIQPKLLSASEKAKRWSKIWGSLQVSCE